MWLLLVRGDHALNEVKTSKLEGLKAGFRFATEAEILEHFGCKPGYLGPIGLKQPVKVIADRTVAHMADFICGANDADFHFTGVNWGRDLPEPDIGLRLYEHGRQIRNELEAARETVTTLGQTLQGRVRLSVPSGYGQLVMAPWLIDFKRAYPGIVLDVVFENRVVDLMRGLLRHAIDAAQGGADRPAPKTLTLVVPQVWGGVRRGVVERAADGLAGGRPCRASGARGRPTCLCARALPPSVTQRGSLGRGARWTNCVIGA